ncbi:zinc finger and BTB domain-containing protein 41 [Synchiropus splendidus]|uniref:zinc finger and BTB domain-containing protein 41 n=1 Tax=Synchiropus splendidus TaxID=270530 RepID=UPI00237EC0EE|nr:zinc finger and BTB domain-containing protein 41 [Synchiropus splendidus]
MMMMKKRSPARPKHSSSVPDGSTASVPGCSPPPLPDSAPPSAHTTRHLTMSHYGHNLLKFLYEDRSRQRFCDVSVSVGGRLYSAHKVVLAHGSSYFHAELSKNPAMTQVTLDHVEESIFQHLLGFLYTSECVISETELQALTEAARFLDMMDILKLLCKDEDNRQANARQPEEGPEVEVTSCDSGIGPQMNIAVAPETAKDTETSGQKVPNTRRSTRKRVASNIKKDLMNTSEVAESTSEDVMSQQTPRQDTMVSCEEDDGEVEAATSAKERSPDETEAEEQAGGDADITSSKVEGSGAVYPDGLAPIVVTQTGGKKNLMCPKCDKTFDRAGKYKSHTRVHTGEKPFQCDICLQCYSTKSNMMVHKKKHSSDAPLRKKEHKCPFCFKLHASKKTLAKHVRRFHPDNIQEFLARQKKRKSEGWKCAVCFKTFTRRPHLEEHMILHTQDRPFKCSFCDEVFKSRFTRLKHQEKYHLGPFPCGICGRQFNDTGNLKRHIECTHGGKRKWTCGICGKSVRERTTLKEHMRIHSGEKPHLCSICGQSFRHGSSYRLHLRVHHDDKRYECDQCGKTFIRHDHLTKHQKIHSGEKAHQCEECGKCFRRHDHLSVHYRNVHLGEKVWQKYKTAVHQCDVCKKEFKGKSSLEMHFRTHSGEKPFKCPECHLTFRIKKTLTKHMVIHSDARPFSCPHCSATFKRKDKLKSHVDHVHSFTQQQGGNPGGDKAADSVEAYGSDADRNLKEGSSSDCVPITIIPVQISSPPPSDVSEGRGAQGHGVVTMPTPLQQQQRPGFQAPTDLAFLEKYTLAPQPANIVRPEQMLDTGQQQSYLGALLGLDTAPSVESHRPDLD